MSESDLFLIAAFGYGFVFGAFFMEWRQKRAEHKEFMRRMDVIGKESHNGVKKTDSQEHL